MKKAYIIILIITSFFVLPTLAFSEDMFLAKVSKNDYSSFNLNDLSSGNFCMVERVNVCVLTESEKDCLKLGGENAQSCENAALGSTKVHKTFEDANQDQNSSMPEPASDEPVFCYGF